MEDGLTPPEVEITWEAGRCWARAVVNGRVRCTYVRMRGPREFVERQAAIECLFGPGADDDEAIHEPGLPCRCGD